MQVGRASKARFIRMPVTGEQIRKEQEESRTRSQLGYRKQVSAPVPPPWDSFWRARARSMRRFWFAFAGFAVAVAATIWLTESIRPNRGFGFFLVLFYLPYTMVANRMELICPRCGHRFHGGRWSRPSCQNCGLAHGQCDNLSGS